MQAQSQYLYRTVCFIQPRSNIAVQYAPTTYTDLQCGLYRTETAAAHLYNQF